MAHYVICAYCNQKFDRDKEPFRPFGARRYMHEKCFNIQQSKLSQDEKDYNELIDYIKALFNTNTINKKISTQIKEYRETYKYRYLAIRDTLRWWYEIEGNSIKDANGGIGIVPFIYDQAKEYFSRLCQAKSANTQQEIKNYQNKIIEVEIAPPRARRQTKKLFDLGEVVDE